MTVNSYCAEGDHVNCSGNCAKWVAASNDVIVDHGPLIESDGVGVLVACQCPCHTEGGR